MRTRGHIGLTDAELVATYRRGDRAAFDALVRRHLRPIYRFVFRLVGNAHDAEDLSQEVFVRAWKGIARFDEKRSFTAWLFQIARNAAVDLLRKRSTMPVATPEETDHAFERLRDPGPLPLELIAQSDSARALSIAIEQLPSASRIVLVLRYRKQLTFREIAAYLQEPLHTVKSRHHRALATLRLLVQTKDGAVLPM